MMTLKNVPSVPIGSSSRRAPKIVSEGHNNGNRRRRRCISAAYRDTGFRKRGMSILQAPPRATSKGGNGEWWPESPRWRAGRPPAGRVTYYFQQLWHACMSALRDHRGVPETPSGALQVHKLCTISGYVAYDHLSHAERRLQSATSGHTRMQTVFLSLAYGP